MAEGQAPGKKQVELEKGVRWGVWLESGCGYHVNLETFIMTTNIEKNETTFNLEPPEFDKDTEEFHPIYIRKRTLRTVPYESQGQYKITVNKLSEGEYQFKRTETQFLLAEEPLRLTVYSDRVIAKLFINLYIYNQQRLASHGNLNVDEIEWSNKDFYQGMVNQVTINLERRFDIFNLEVDQRNIEKEIIDQTTLRTFTSSSIPDSSDGEDEYRRVISRYKERAFYIPALLDYAVENDNLVGDQDRSPKSVEHYLSEEKDLFWSEGELILPEEPDFQAPTSEDVQTFIDNWSDPKIIIK